VSVAAARALLEAESRGTLSAALAPTEVDELLEVLLFANANATRAYGALLLHYLAVGNAAVHPRVQSLLVRGAVQDAALWSALTADMLASPQHLAATRALIAAVAHQVAQGGSLAKPQVTALTVGVDTMAAQLGKVLAGDFWVDKKRVKLSDVGLDKGGVKALQRALTDLRVQAQGAQRSALAVRHARCRSVALLSVLTAVVLVGPLVFLLHCRRH